MHGSAKLAAVTAKYFSAAAIEKIQQSRVNWLSAKNFTSARREPKTFSLGVCIVQPTKLQY